MHRLVWVVLLTILGLGVMSGTPLCTTDTVANYVANYGPGTGNGCMLGPLQFESFTYSPNSNGPAVMLNADQADLRPLANANGWGFEFVPLIAWTASPTGRTDAEFQFIVRSASGANIINDLYLALTGSASGPGGSDILTEDYCLGGTYVPPTGPCVGGDVVRVEPILANTMGTETATLHVSFTPVSSIVIRKDMDVRGISPDGNSTGTAQITSVIDQISVVPEPGALSLLVVGGLMLVAAGYGRRRLGS